MGASRVSAGTTEGSEAELVLQSCLELGLKAWVSCQLPDPCVKLQCDSDPLGAGMTYALSD